MDNQVLFPHSPNQVLTHAARAAAEQLNCAREGLWLEQVSSKYENKDFYLYFLLFPLTCDLALVRRVALTRALRARRARPPEVARNRCLFSCFAAARAACVSTWLGEFAARMLSRRAPCLTLLVVSHFRGSAAGPYNVRKPLSLIGGKRRKEPCSPARQFTPSFVRMRV